MNRVGFLAVVGSALTWIGALRIAQVEKPERTVGVWAVVFDYLNGEEKTTTVVSVFATEHDANLFINAKQNEPSWGVGAYVGEGIRFPNLRTIPMRMLWSEVRALYNQAGTILPA